MFSSLFEKRNTMEYDYECKRCKNNILDDNVLSRSCRQFFKQQSCRLAIAKAYVNVPLVDPLDPYRRRGAGLNKEQYFPKAFGCEITLQSIAKAAKAIRPSAGPKFPHAFVNQGDAAYIGKIDSRAIHGLDAYGILPLNAHPWVLFAIKHDYTTKD
jgi:hypothetical protein